MPPRSRPPASGRGRRLAALIALVLAIFAGTPLTAQVEAEPPVLRGTVLRGEAPLGDASVVLHRVDAIEAGEIDSIRTGPDGGFALALPRVPDPEGTGEVYFASVRHQGILYFGPPVASVAELDSAYLIQTYDTVRAPSGGAAIPISVRYILAEPAAGGGWTVTDLIELGVEGDRTFVAPPGEPTWGYPLPEGIREVQVGGGDIAPNATTISEGRVSVSMPLSPGSRQLVLRYLVDSLSLRWPLPGEVGEFELLVQEPAPPLEVEGLVAVQPIEPEPGNTYRRYTAVALSDSVVVVRPGEAPTELPVRELAVLAAFLLTGLGLFVVYRRGGFGPSSPTSPTGSSRPGASGAPAGAATAEEVRDRLLLAIAELDEELERTEDEDRRGRIELERARMMERLRELS